MSSSGGSNDEVIKPTEQGTHIKLTVNFPYGGCMSGVIFRMKKNTQLKKLMNAYCDHNSVDLNLIAFYFDAHRLQEDQCPDELHMEDGDEIEVSFTNICAIIDLKVKSQDGYEASFKIHRKTPLKKLMDRYCLGVDGVIFRYNGYFLRPEQTPDELYMGYGDEINVVCCNESARTKLKAKCQELTSLNAPQENHRNLSTNDTQSKKQSTESTNSSRGKSDPAWEHFAFKKEGKINVYTCIHCGLTYKGGGINRIKIHLAGMKGQISSCKKVPLDVRHRMLELLRGIQDKKNIEELNDAFDDQTNEEEVQEVQPCPNIVPNKGKRKASVQIGSCFAPRTTPNSQPSRKCVLSSKDTIHKAKMAIARWFFDSNLPFKATKSPYFQAAVDAIAAIGPGFKVPSYHEMRINLLGDCKKECQLLVESYRANWVKSGCTIMADGWSDQKQRTLINFLVYCPTGITFVKSSDASDVVKDPMALCNLFSEVIDWVKPENVVHIVTDNTANYVAAGRLVHEKYETIFWSPCAAHCLNLLLKDIGSMSHVTELASKASKVTLFMYNHMIFLSWLRKREGWKEIVRPGVTRFATTFITLKNIYDHKQDLQALVVDKHFTSHKLAKTAVGKAISAIILDSKFWDDCFMIAKLVAPIIRLLRIVDEDEKPSMGYVYECMQRAKNTMKEMFRNRRVLYKPFTDIIKARWDKHLKCNLHAVAYFLNPAFFYDEKFHEKSRVMEALITLLKIKAFCPDMAKAIKEMQVYRDRQESFSRVSALSMAKAVRPDQWWRLYGGSAPILQKLAIRLLSQTTTSLGCERNWSVFEHIHTEKRNRLEHQRLNDLVYVAYNLRLKNRWNYKKTRYDPIDYESIDNVDFWVIEEETSPELDIDEIENVLYHDSAVPVVGGFSRNDEGDEEPNTTEFQLEEDATGDAIPNIFDYEGLNLNDYYDD